MLLPLKRHKSDNGALQVRVTDIAGLVRGASEGAGLGNKFLSHIRNVDAVVRGLSAP